jgi:alkylation response protein AidB-like acyl-CoA dehydrogenase
LAGPRDVPEHAVQAGGDGYGADRGRGVHGPLPGTARRGKLDTVTASKSKLLGSEVQCRIIDECVQLHGGYGYMWEYPVARAFADSRVQRIYGGTSEVMKLIIGRALTAD